MATSFKVLKGRLGLALLAGLVAAGVGCQPRQGYYLDDQLDERLITPAGVGDSLAVYRTSNAAPRPGPGGGGEIVVLRR